MIKSDNDIIVEKYVQLHLNQPDEYNTWSDFEYKDNIIDRAVIKVMSFIQNEMNDNNIEDDSINRCQAVDDLILKLQRYKENNCEIE